MRATASDRNQSIDLSSKDFFAGRDPALEAIVTLIAAGKD